jgi:hypothetical protein
MRTDRWKRLELLVDALLDIFPIQADLRQLLVFDEMHDVHALPPEGARHRDFVYSLVQQANGRDTILRLVSIAAKANPRNPRLREFAALNRIKLSHPPSPGPGGDDPENWHRERYLVSRIILLCLLGIIGSMVASYFPGLPYQFSISVLLFVVVLALLLVLISCFLAAIPNRTAKEEVVQEIHRIINIRISEKCLKEQPDPGMEGLDR